MTDLAALRARHVIPHWCRGTDPIVGEGERMFGLRDGVVCDAAALLSEVESLRKVRDAARGVLPEVMDAEIGSVASSEVPLARPPCRPRTHREGGRPVSREPIRRWWLLWSLYGLPRCSSAVYPFDESVEPCHALIWPWQVRGLRNGAPVHAACLVAEREAE